MRDPNRIENILAQLAQIWHKNPDLRLGQLIANTRIHENDLLFYNIEDQTLIDYFKNYYGIKKEED